MLGIYPVANVKFSNTGFDRSTLFQGREGSCAFFPATKIRLPLLPSLPPSVTRAEARQRPRFNRATTRVSIQFRPTVHHRPTVSLVFLAALRRRNFFEGFTAVLPRDPTVDLTALLSPAVSIYPATLPLFLFLFSFFLARDRRERERRPCAGIAPATLPFSPPSSFDPRVFVFLSLVFPMGNVVTFQSLWKPGRIEMGTHPLPILPFPTPPVFLSLPLFVTYSTRILPPLLSLFSFRDRAPIFL